MHANDLWLRGKENGNYYYCIQRRTEMARRIRVPLEKRENILWVLRSVQSIAPLSVKYSFSFKETLCRHSSLPLLGCAFLHIWLHLPTLPINITNYEAESNDQRMTHLLLYLLKLDSGFLINNIICIAHFSIATHWTTTHLRRLYSASPWGNTHNSLMDFNIYNGRWWPEETLWSLRVTLTRCLICMNSNEHNNIIRPKTGSICEKKFDGYDQRFRFQGEDSDQRSRQERY